MGGPSPSVSTSRRASPRVTKILSIELVISA
jgi:hypothetical protein